MNINHIHIGTKDLKRSVDFCSTIFGFSKHSAHGQGMFLRNEAGFLIAIDSVNEIQSFPSWFHIGFCLKSASEVHSIYQSDVPHQKRNRQLRYAAVAIMKPSPSIR